MRQVTFLRVRLGSAQAGDERGLNEFISKVAETRSDSQETLASISARVRR